MREIFRGAMEIALTNFKKWIKQKLCDHKYGYVGTLNQNEFNRITCFECSECGQRMIITNFSPPKESLKFLKLWIKGHLEIDFENKE